MAYAIGEPGYAHPSVRRPTDADIDVGPAIDRLLAGLRSELGVTIEQTRAWLDFAAACRANAERVDILSERCSHRSADPRPGSADTLDDVFGSLEERLEAMSAIRFAGERLYPGLTPRQRFEADRLLPMCCIARVWSHASEAVSRDSPAPECAAHMTPK